MIPKSKKLGVSCAFINLILSFSMSLIIFIGRSH